MKAKNHHEEESQMLNNGSMSKHHDVLEGEFMSDMSIRMYMEYLHSDQMCLYLRQKPKINDYSEVSK